MPILATRRRCFDEEFSRGLRRWFRSLHTYIRLLKHLPADMGVAIVSESHHRDASGCIDFVLPPEDIAKEIVRIASAEAPVRSLESLAARPRLGPWPRRTSP